MQQTAQQAADYESIQKSREADEIKQGAAKVFGDRIKSINDKMTLQVYGERVLTAGLSDKLKRRVAKWLQEREEEL